MKIKKDDKVIMLAGKDKGKKGKVLQIFSKENKVVVEGLNLRVKNTRPRRQGEKGQQIQFPAAVDVSNVQLVCSKCGQPTRIVYSLNQDSGDQKVKLKQKKFRRCQKCKQVIE
ncbi:MAG: 50S ribosomal protein L24 [Patescibacteria group bacterium]